MKKIFALLFVLAFTGMVKAEDGSRLWLQFEKNASDAKVTSELKTQTAAIAVKELTKFWKGGEVSFVYDKTLPTDGSYCITVSENSCTISAANDIGILYGAYSLLRMQQTNSVKNAVEHPRFALRLLNHWDNPDLSVERGYAGLSIWRWNEIDGKKGTTSDWMKQHIEQYGRINASIGINGTVLNNVNASPKMLTQEYLRKVKVIADGLRPYGIKVYLSVNFGSPKALGEVNTADPLDKKVRVWWVKKAKEIYRLIPDFGGFLVKANSEGQPGPGDYNRTHADGANMLADAVKPFGGIIMWRSFVYGSNHKNEDRVKQAVSEFKPVDGQFRDNVIIQCKNGPLDFQPREPYAPIFDQMKNTPLMPELQITQEYLGQSRHLVYLAPMWKEFFSQLAPDVMANFKAIAGVANTGDDANWCGHHFSQANWYAFGRLAWNPDLTSEEIAKEWMAQTFTADEHFINPMMDVMMTSREACVDYMMPLGLHHIFAADQHYGPEPQGNQPHFPMEWRPVYYHKADKQGVGFDRSSTGTNAVEQYREPYASIYNKVETCPENLLLWFHHVPWNYRMKSGRTLWQELNFHYNRGVSEVERYVGIWERMRPYVDEQRHKEVTERLEHQLDNANEWRNKCIEYFGSFAKQ